VNVTTLRSRDQLRASICRVRTRAHTAERESLYISISLPQPAQFIGQPRDPDPGRGAI